MLIRSTNVAFADNVSGLYLVPSYVNEIINLKQNIKWKRKHQRKQELRH